jgi:hypothetical protein
MTNPSLPLETLIREEKYMRHEGSRTKAVEERFRNLEPSYQKAIELKLEEFREMGFHQMPYAEMGRLLHGTQAKWDRETFGPFRFDDFELKLINELSLRLHRSNLKNFKSFYRVYHPKPSADLAKLNTRQIEALVYNHKRPINSSLLAYPLDGEDFYFDPERIFDDVLQGKTDPAFLVEEIKNRKRRRDAGPSQSADFRGEEELGCYMWQNRERLRHFHEMELVCRQARLPDSGSVDFIGCKKDRLIIIEVKLLGDTQGVGQILAYLNEVKEILETRAKPDIRSVEGNFKDLLNRQAWQRVEGYLVAERFSERFRHAIKGQEVLVCRAFRGNKILSKPFDAKAGDDWAEFLAQDLPL